MAKKINILMSLQDHFTKPLGQTTKEIQKSRLEIKKAGNVLSSWGNSTNKTFKNVAKGALDVTKKIAAVGAGLATGAGVVGFSEAFNMETYRTQLITATKDTQKATKIMKDAISLANKTPFEGGEIVAGAASLESMGMSAEKWLPMAADMAGATGKDFQQAVEAIIDAQSGEWERMKEFGIKGVDNMDDLVNVMNTRFAGGAEALSQTTKGMWSTVTGVAKNSLAKIVGIMDDGTVRQGSALDYVRQKIQTIADKLTQWQNDGTIDKISEKAVTVIEKVGAGIEKAKNLLIGLKQNANLLLPALSGLVAAFVAFNVISKVIKLWQAYKAIATGVTAAQGVLNFVLTANPIGMIVLAIGALVAAGVALYMNWDKVKATALSLWSTVKEVFGGIKDAIVGAFNSAVEKAKWFFDTANAGMAKFKNGIESIPVVGGVVKAVTGHATGTSYFKGGLTRVNEGGRGELITLPSGTKILPHTETKELINNDRRIKTDKPVSNINNTNNNVYNLNINVSGGGDNTKETGRKVAEEIIKALDIA